ncbi:MAG: VWA domain-containing protein [Nitrospiraceae bacterium]|nr:VWA domain-containing protein [Nitrospiraceae bacterium]
MDGLMGTLRGAFLAPVFFAFLGLIPVVVVLYLLKLRRTHVVISSTLLWHKSLQDLTANAPFQRLRKNLLLLLQIIVLLMLVAGLARPFVRADAAGGSDRCLLFDTSASMQTLEKGKTRLELAKEKALEIVDDMVGGDKMMVVTFNRSSDVLCELMDNRVRLRAAIRSIEASDASTRVRDAVLVASSLQAAQANLRIVILGDGKIADLADIGSRAFDVTYLQVGETDENAGIVAFSVRDSLEGQGERQCLVLLRNEASSPLVTTLTLYLDDEVMAVEEVAVAGRDMGELLFALPPVETGVLRAELDWEDALAVDNIAWLVLRPASLVRVLLVAESDSAGAYFLKRVLALSPQVELSTILPADYARSDDYDLTIFDGHSPAEAPQGTSVYINAYPPLEGLGTEGMLEKPGVIATDAEHPVMRFLNPSNVNVTKAQRLTLPEGSRTLVSSRGGALVADVSRGGKQMVVVAFDLADSNWPLRLSFPLFVQNLIAWTPRATLTGESSVRAGESLTLLGTNGADTAEVTLPDGGSQTLRLDPTRPSYFGDTREAGLYDVVYGEHREVYAVNLLDLNESSVSPAPSLTIGRSDVVGERGGIEQDRELWHWFVMAALGVLALEWWVYSRRAWL